MLIAVRNSFDPYDDLTIAHATDAFGPYVYLLCESFVTSRGRAADATGFGPRSGNRAIWNSPSENRFLNAVRDVVLWTAYRCRGAGRSMKIVPPRKPNLESGLVGDMRLVHLSECSVGCLEVFLTVRALEVTSTFHHDFDLSTADRARRRMDSTAEGQRDDQAATGHNCHYTDQPNEDNISLPHQDAESTNKDADRHILERCDPGESDGGFWFFVCHCVPCYFFFSRASRARTSLYAPLTASSEAAKQLIYISVSSAFEAAGVNRYAVIFSHIAFFDGPHAESELTATTTAYWMNFAFIGLALDLIFSRPAAVPLPVNFNSRRQTI